MHGKVAVCLHVHAVKGTHCKLQDLDDQCAYYLKGLSKKNGIYFAILKYLFFVV